ncbi:MAG: HAMP domain-containing histidine kinase [Clostridia bacterium]|nr:HAMP domain-containing histidine kinase [Clostridia bacterium]
MLGKLRRKFILINMLLVGVTVLFVFGAVLILTYRAERAEIDLALEEAMRFTDSEKPPVGGEPLGDRIQLGGREPVSVVPAVAVRVSDAGEIIGSFGNGAEMEDDILAAAVSAVQAKGRERGTLSDMGLRYRMRQTPEGVLMAFASSAPLYTSVRNTALIAGGVCAAALVLFFLISYYLSGVVIRPIAQAWEGQRRFVADASHDLRTPLTVILANLDILRLHEKESVSSQMRWIRGAAEEAERMRGLTCQMLDLARSEDLGEHLALIPTNVSELTERSLLQFEPVAFEKQITLEGEIAPDVILDSHGDSFVRMLHILIDNGLKYTKNGGTVRVFLTTRGREISLSVHNEAVIEPAELPHIFERFWRADKTRGKGGWGLGLSIAKNLAEALGGTIRVRSTPESGTQFTVTFKRI